MSEILSPKIEAMIQFDEFVSNGLKPPTGKHHHFFSRGLLGQAPILMAFVVMFFL